MAPSIDGFRQLLHRFICFSKFDMYPLAQQAFFHFSWIWSFSKYTCILWIIICIVKLHAQTLVCVFALFVLILFWIISNAAWYIMYHCNSGTLLCFTTLLSFWLNLSGILNSSYAQCSSADVQVLLFYERRIYVVAIAICEYLPTTFLVLSRSIYYFE